MRFNMKPGPGDSDFEQWQSAMKMVARLPDGVPHEFRNTVRSYFVISNDTIHAVKYMRYSRRYKSRFPRSFTATDKNVDLSTLHLFVHFYTRPRVIVMAYT